MAPGFSEEEYLAANPAVAAAVQTGDVPSGWLHYLMRGCREARSGVPEATARLVARTSALLDVGAMEPLPADHLRKRVHGEEDAVTFEQVGRIMAAELFFLARSMAVSLPRGSQLLDFGCGCGRVARYLGRLLPDAAYTGTDIDAEAVAWCDAHLAHLGSFMVNQPDPPLASADQSFDLVVAVSVFTHLPLAMQLAWLAELRRVTRPGGHLVLTVHGDDALTARWPGERGRPTSTGCTYVVGCGTSGLPDFYQSAYVTEAFVRDEWARHFEIVDIVKLSGLQNAVLCRKAG